MLRNIKIMTKLESDHFNKVGNKSPRHETFTIMVLEMVVKAIRFPDAHWHCVYFRNSITIN